MADLLHDPAVRDQIDAVMLTRAMLDRTPWPGPPPLLYAEVGPLTDSMLMSHDVLLYHVGAPVQPDLNMRAWLWRFTVDLTLLGMDPERLFRAAARLNRTVAMWPHMDPTPYGKVGRILENPGFQIVSPGDITSSKGLRAWHSSKRVQAADPSRP